MSVLSQFNKTVDEFLNDLLVVFPGHKGIKKQKLKFEVGCRANARIALDAIMPELIKYSQDILNKNESIIPNIDCAFAEIDLVQLWNSGITIDTKNTIWQYIQTLLMLGTQIFFQSQSNIQ